MSVITVSRGTFSGGKILAECLAQQLEYRCIDRDVIVERAAASGVSQEELRNALEKPPTLLERFQHRKYLYLTLIQAALTEEVRTGRVVYHGNAGHLLLRPGGPVFRLRIIAPLEFRIKMCQDRLRLNRSEAVAYIQRMDQDRQKWTHYLYGVDWGNPTHYDLVINLEHVSIDSACDMLAHHIRQQSCHDFGPDCQAFMNDLAQASQVKAKLALHPPTSDLEVEVEAAGGSVRIRGRVLRVQDIDEVVRVAGQTPGVSEVNVEQLVPSVHP